MVEKELPERYAGTDPGAFVVMPNHAHGIITITAKRINRLRGTPGEAVWQRNYYEHIMRGRRDLERIRRYIAENPARWARDRNHPDRLGDRFT